MPLAIYNQWAHSSGSFVVWSLLVKSFRCTLHSQQGLVVAAPISGSILGGVSAPPIHSCVASETAQPLLLKEEVWSAQAVKCLNILYRDQIIKILNVTNKTMCVCEL